MRAPAPPGWLGGGPRACCGPTGDPGSPCTGRRGLCFEATFVSLKVVSGSSCQSRALAESARLLGCCSQNHWRGGSACASDCVVWWPRSWKRHWARGPGLQPALPSGPRDQGATGAEQGRHPSSLPPAPAPRPPDPQPLQAKPLPHGASTQPLLSGYVRTPGPRLVPADFRDPLCHGLYNSLGDSAFGGIKEVGPGAQRS